MKEVDIENAWNNDDCIDHDPFHDLLLSAHDFRLLSWIWETHQKERDLRCPRQEAMECEDESRRCPLLMGHQLLNWFASSFRERKPFPSKVLLTKEIPFQKGIFTQKEFLQPPSLTWSLINDTADNRRRNREDNAVYDCRRLSLE